MEKSKKRGIVIGILITIVVMVAVYCILNATNVVNFSSKQNSINLNGGNDLPGQIDGTYKWSKSYTNEDGKIIKLRVVLILNEDGTATYDASDGYSYEATKGTYKLDNNKLIYTREYYNYPDHENGVFDDDNNKTEIFDVIDKNTLSNTFNNQVTELKRQDAITTGMLVGTYTWSKNYTNQYGSEMKLNITLVLNKDGSATYNAGDGYSAEATKGTYKLENYQIIYTREYYNYPNHENGVFDDDNNKTEIFEVINKDTLSNIFNDQVTELKKVNSGDSKNISKIVGTYEYNYSFTQTDNDVASDCKNITLNEKVVLMEDGRFTYERGATCSGGETANGTYSIDGSTIYLFNDDCNEDANCRQKIKLHFSEKNGVVTIKDNESTSGWKANSNWGSVKLPDTILKKVD